VSDVLADVIFCCTKTDINNLHTEGYNPKRIEFTGDLMKDALLMTLKNTASRCRARIISF
jgi:UDP-N-acetylglucosamine 2-epimerase